AGVDALFFGGGFVVGALDEHACPRFAEAYGIDLERDVRPDAHEANLLARRGMTVEDAIGEGVLQRHDVEAVVVRSRKPAEALGEEKVFAFRQGEVFEHGRIPRAMVRPGWLLLQGRRPLIRVTSGPLRGGP